MNGEAFSADIEPGGLHNVNEIRVLICYILKSVNNRIPKEILIESLQRDGLANYFEIGAALQHLVEKQNIVIEHHENEEYCKITEKGAIIANDLDFVLPVSVKDKAVKVAIRLLSRRKTEKENKVEISTGSQGYNVTCSVGGGQDNLMSVSLNVPDRIQAESIKEQFLNDPEIVYRGVLALLTGDLETAGGLMIFQKDKGNDSVQ